MKLITDEGILVLPGNQPVVKLVWDVTQQAYFGSNRDRYPDSGWGKWRNTRVGEEDGRCKRIQLNEMTPQLIKILIEDICDYFDNKQVVEKLIEFGIVKI